MAELVAVACVVESSLFLASEWSAVLMEYISPLLKRLGEAHAAQSLLFRLAFISYGPANTYPSPIIAKRFFSALQVITKELRDESQKLGIGQTSSGGSGGMAALEGLVAAIEMFDILSDSVKVKPLQSQSLNQAPYVAPRLVSHIIHVAASPPDDALKPLWNDSPELDDASWASLPSELKKRNINLSIINVRPNPPLVELHSAASIKGISPPWFKIRPQHSVLLTGFPTEVKSKRPLESLVSPDTKRPKIQPPAPTINPIPNPNSNISPSPALVPQHNAPQPPQPSTGTAQANPSTMNRITPNPAVLTKYRELEAHIHKLKRDHTAALTQGHAEVAAQLKTELDRSVITLERFKLAIQQNVRQIARPQNLPPPSSANQPPAATTSMTSPQPPQMATSATAMPAAVPPAFPSAQNTQGRTGGQPFPQMGNNLNATSAAPVTSQMTPEMASQMQKLVENRGIRPRQASLSQSTPKLAAPQLPQPMAVAGPSQPDSKTWEGALIWTGFDVTTHDRKEMQAQVKVTSLSQTDIEPIAAPPEFQSWAKRTKALLCGITANPQSGNPQINGQNFRSLVEMLSQKRIYALASWTLPNGKPAPNLLMFPFQNGNLLGAVFPTTGIPEMPKSSVPTTAPIPGLPSNLQAQFQRLTPEQRQLFVAQLMAQRRNVQQQQQQQQQTQPPAFQPQGPTQQGNFGIPAANASTFSGQPNFPPQAGHNMMNLMGASGMSNAQMMSMMAAQPGLPHRRTPSGNPVTQPVGYDILQSFMQRNADGSGAGMGA
ncbi:hypothetical protein HWV62_44653 [Athelia sp. TMB]|nr:hypothetical protein HWV62_44653 [Athelia sp. TMB]